MSEYHKLFIVAALIAFAWILGRAKPFETVKSRLRRAGIRDQIESWYVKNYAGSRNETWTCIDVSFEEYGGPFGFPVTIFVLEAGYQRIAICSEGQDIVVGSRVRFRMRTPAELKPGRLGGMLDCYLMPIPIEG